MEVFYMIEQIFYRKSTYHMNSNGIVFDEFTDSKLYDMTKRIWHGDELNVNFSKIDVIYEAKDFIEQVVRQNGKPDDIKVSSKFVDKEQHYYCQLILNVEILYKHNSIEWWDWENYDMDFIVIYHY